MPLDPRIPTTSLQMARNLLAQPETDPLGLADLQNYDETATQNAVNRNLPDFFRQTAAQLAQYNSGEMQRQAAMDDAATGSGGVQQVDDGSTDFMPTRAGQFRDEYGTSMGDVILSQRAQAEAAQQKQVADMAARSGPALAAPSISGTKVGGFLGKIKDVATEALAPLGHAVEKGFDVAGQAIEALPGVSGEGEAFSRIPEAASVFKKEFAREFEEKTGQPLNFETALAAINKYGLRDTANKLAEKSDVVLTDYTIDPILHATLPDWAADPVVKGMGFAASALPYVALAILSPTAGVSLGATFALSATEDVKNLTAEYKRGNIDGKTFALGVGMDLLDILPEVAVPLVRSARRGFVSRRALADAVEQIDALKTETKGRPTVGVTEVVDERGLAKSMEELDLEKNLAKQGITPEEAAAVQAKPGEPPVEAAWVGELRANLTDAAREQQALAEEAAVAPPRKAGEIAEVRRTPVAEQTGRHRLTTPEGDRLDWRETPEGAHIQDVTVQVERQGTGTAMVERAIADIRAQNPDAVITADLNSEGGARLMARQGAEFATKDGAPLTPEEAIASAARNEGPVATLRSETKPSEIATTPEVTSPLEADPAFKAFEAEADAGVQEHLAPLAKGARDEIGDRITIQDGAYKALEDYGVAARGMVGLSAPMKAAVRAITDGRTSFVKSLPVENLHDISANEGLPKWQREIATNELTARTQPVENAVAAFKQADAPVQQTLRDMGYEHMPSNPVEVANVHRAMDDLGSADSIPALQEWMSKNAGLLEQLVSTGADSPFRVNGKFDFEAARNNLRSQARRSGKLNDLDGTERPVADAIGNRKSADLGNCGMKAVA